ncbi:MAG: carbohydrate ABC transporter permease [Myxococcota bacterium]
MADPGSPTSAALRGALAVALAVSCVAGAATGLARYLTSLDHRDAVLEAVAERADALAARVAAGGALAARDVEDAAAVAVVVAGAVDGFGIARGAEVAVDRVLDPVAAPADADTHRRALVDRSAALADGSAERFDVREAGDAVLVSAVAPVLEGGDYQGMVRIVRRVGEAPDPVPGWRLSLGVLLAALAAFLALRAGAPPTVPLGVIGAAAAAFVVLAMPGTFIGWAAAVAGVATAVFARPLAGVFRGLREQPGTYAYIAPAILAMVVLVFVPFAMGVALAFFDADGRPVGLANFAEILAPDETSDTNFYWTLFITVAWTASNVVLHLAIGLGLALVLNRPSLRFRGLYRILLIVPWAVPNYITALLWKWMFNTQYGAVNAFLAVFGIDRVDWLGNSVLTNFTANLVTNVWLGFPFMMVVSLGALQSIPRELYEAATIDGAGRVQAFRHVTVPLLKPALLPAIILGSIWTFNMFNVIYLVSGGAPDNETNILITEAYHAFKVLQREGFAAAYALLIFVILYAYGRLTDRISRASEGAFE